MAVFAIFPRSKDWDNGVSPPIVMKIGGRKKSATMNIYLRLAGIDTKGATDCLHFVPEDINFEDKVV
jgi:hypothetical protein